MDLVRLNETEMYNAIDRQLKQTKEATIIVYCAIHGNYDNGLKSTDNANLKAFATKYTRNNKGFYNVYLS